MSRQQKLDDTLSRPDPVEFKAHQFAGYHLLFHPED
jgi:hypothetical protein